MDTVTVKSLMIPVEQFPRVSQEKTFGAAAEALDQCHLDFKAGNRPTCILLVQDAQNRIVGKISPVDLLRALEPQYTKLRGTIGEYSRGLSYDKMIDSALDHSALWSKPLNELCTKSGSLKIKDFILHPATEQTVSMTDSLDKALHRFVMGRHDSLFVMDGKRLVGMLLFKDVYGHILSTIKDSCPLEA
jgi:CBS domain containing-hemolysin-like protein